MIKHKSIKRKLLRISMIKIQINFKQILLILKKINLVRLNIKKLLIIKIFNLTQKIL